MTRPLPNLIYAGTGKAGTTWLFATLARHPQVFLTPVKETNFFDLNYDRDLDWYAEFFADAGDAPVIGEIAHRYLRNPDTAQRIKDSLGSVKILVGLREPADYVLSDYLFTKRNGGTDLSVADYVARQFNRDAIAYGDLVRPYVGVFGADAIHVCDFSELGRAPQTYLNKVTDFLGIDRFPLEADDTKPVNKAKAARSKSLAAAASKTSKWLKRRGGQRIIQRVKANSLVQKTLYRGLDAKPELPADLAAELRAFSRPGIEDIDATFGTDLIGSWYGDRP